MSDIFKSEVRWSFFIVPQVIPAAHCHVPSVAARAEIGRVLAQRFPDYAALSKPQPLGVSDVSSLLADDEALVLVDLGKGKEDASYIWVVDRPGAVWNTIDAKSEDLTDRPPLSGPGRMLV